MSILLVNSRIIWIFHWGQLPACLLINLIAAARMSCSSVSWREWEFVQAEPSRAAPTLLVGLLQGRSIKFTLNYNDSLENIIVVELSIQGPAYSNHHKRVCLGREQHCNEWKASTYTTPNQRFSNHSWETVTRHSNGFGRLWVFIIFPTPKIQQSYNKEWIKHCSDAKP